MADLIGQYHSGRIVVGVDGSEASKDALRWAIGEAERTGSSVEAIMTWEQATAAYQFGMPLPTEFGAAPIMTALSTGLWKRSPASTLVLTSQPW